jgi:hypothetical protein
MERAFRVILLCCCLLFAAKMLWYHYHLIVFPWPLHYRETTALLSTDLLLHGQNPFSFDVQPVATNVYGIVYTLAVYPVARLFGSGPTVHRAVTGVFILCSCGLLAGINRRFAVAAAYNAAFVLLFYAALLFFKTPLSEPDALGTFLYLCCLFVPVFDGYSTRSLCVSMVIGLIAFYTKQYFILAVPILLLYVFLFVSKKRAIQAGTVFFFLFIGAAVVVHKVFESYFYNTLLMQMSGVADDKEWLLEQLQAFGYYSFAPLFLVGAWSVATLGKNRALSFAERKQRFLSALHVTEMRLPFLEASINPAAFASGIVFCLIYLKLGRQNGAYMTYWFQLLTPLVLIWAASSLRTPERLAVFVIPLLIANLYVASREYVNLEEDLSRHNGAAWQRAKELVSTHKNILNSALVATLLFEQKKPIYDGGQSMYFICSTLREPPLAPLFPQLDMITLRYKTFVATVYESIADKRFDLVMLDTSASKWIIDRDFLAQHYTPVERLRLCMPPRYDLWGTWDVEVWTPKPQPSRGGHTVQGTVTSP